MADEDLDIETLTALLEDDSDEEETPQETSKPDLDQGSNDESDIATLAAFLEDSDSDEDVPESGEPSAAKGDVESSEDANGSQTNSAQQDESVNQTSPGQSAENMNALQNQILMMQKQMEQMQKLLLQQQTQGSQGEITPDVKATHHQPKTKPSPKSSVSGKSTTINTRDSPSNKISKQSSTNSIPKRTPKSQPKDKICSKEIKSIPSPQHKAAKMSSLSDTTKLKQTTKKEQEHNPFFDESEESPSKDRETSPVHVKGKSPSDTIKSSEALRRKEQEKSLFGDDSDSDWEGLDGEEKTRLTTEGNELRKLLHHGEKGRVSNATKQDVEELRKRAAKTSWKDHSHQQPSVASKIGTPVNKASKENDLPSVTDPFSGIRMINPKVSSTDMKYKMADRNMVKVSRIASQVGTSKLQGNWVTIAVVVSKTESRTSAAGKTYCIWKLSDLEDCDKTVSFFLFGEVYKQHWKNSVGTVAGILNPSIMDKAEKVQQDVAFTVNHPQQLLVMGQSKDLGRCTGVSKAGKPCTKFINKQHGDRCTYHVQSAYKKTSSHRTELQGSFTGMTPKAHAWNQNKKASSSFFFYQGETFTDLRPPANKKDKVTLNKLSEKQAVQSKGKVTTMSLHNLEPEDQKLLKDLKDKKNEFVDLLTTPTVGAMNFVKHLVKEEKCVKETDGNKVLVQSITPKELLQQHKLAAQERRRQLSQGRAVNPLEAVPTLGKGFSPGSDISLELSFPRGKSVGIKMDLAKKKAIAKIHVSGGINKDDPNAVRKKMRSPESNVQVRKRVAENMDSSDKAKDGSPVLEPPRKRSKLLGNIDVNSEEFKQLMKVRSKHKGALAEVEAEHEERYFMAMEKKEKYEDKMSSIMEMKCKVFTCVQCNYTAFKPGDSCKENGHTIKMIETKKRFFKCKKCNHRAISIHKYPTEPCRNCGEQNFERTSMYQEKKTKTPSEELCIRGDEIKYLGSMQEKSFLNI